VMKLHHLSETLYLSRGEHELVLMKTLLHKDVYA
jgi:hypothetical protein